MTDKDVSLELNEKPNIENDESNHEEFGFYKQDFEDAIRHGICVSRLSQAIARELGLSDDQVNQIAVAGMLHDIGKLKISPYIYGRTRKTMKIEDMRYVRLHAKLGSEIVREKGYGDEIGDIILYHHENYDGSGYPYCLSGEEIPLGSRIIRVSDVFIALISDRTYRKAFDPHAALSMVIDEVRHFDMKVFLAFQRIINTTDVLDDILQILKEFHIYTEEGI